MTAESTDQINRKRLAAAWARTYGAGRTAPQRLEADDEPRPIADARAAWRRWHDASLDRRWSAAEWPWFEALERARVEQLASAHLPGMASNLADPDRTAPPPFLPGDIYRSARRIFAGADSMAEPVFTSTEARGIHQRWKTWLARRRLTLTDSDIIAALRNARQTMEHPAQFADEVAPLISMLAELPVRHPASSPAQASLVPTTNPSIDEQEAGETERDDAHTEAPGDDAGEPDILRAFPNYRIYNKAWDEEGPATQWLRPQDRELLKSLLNPDRRKIQQLAHKLQRRLKAASLRRWQFDQEEGLLDPRRLSRLVSGRASHRIFRREDESPVPLACVSLLVDLSGSMRGQRQRIAAIAVDLAVHTLELCGIESEVLGYTTVYGADNPIASQWLRAGESDNPGRLNATRHIVFKSPGQRWRRARSSLGLMLREDFGRENIDGEALHWAARRLALRPEPNRILIVLSDGQPYDEVTASANGRSFLEDHLRSVIKEIDLSNITLSAIGTGMSVSRFYHNSATTHDPESLGGHLFDHLEDLVVTPKTVTGHP